MKAVREKAGLKCLVILVKQKQELLPLQLRCTVVTAGRRKSLRSPKLKKRLLPRMMGLNRSFTTAIEIVDEAEDVVVTSEAVDVTAKGFVVGVAEVTEVMEASAVGVAVGPVERAFVVVTEDVREMVVQWYPHRGPLRQVEQKSGGPRRVAFPRLRRPTSRSGGIAAKLARILLFPVHCIVWQESSSRAKVNLSYVYVYRNSA
jgi:hypothetical protein